MERSEFTNQYGDTVRQIECDDTIFSIEILDDKGEQKEINEDFFFRYGRNINSEIAFEKLTK